jgi:hypothetical protein
VRAVGGCGGKVGLGEVVVWGMDGGGFFWSHR